MELLCTTISLVLGLYFLRNNIVFSILISLAYLVFIFIRFNKKTFFISLSLFAIGACLGNINLEYNSKNNEYAGIVIESKANYILFQSRYEKFYVYEKDNNYEIGDYLVISGEPSKLKITTYESQFNFEDYLNNKGIKRELKYNIIDIKYSSFIKLKRFKNNFLSHFDENTAPLINSFLFNEKDYSSDAIKFTSELNLTHMFTLSGVYLHLIFAALTYVLSLKFSDKSSEILPFIILLPYALFSLTKIGTLRVYALYLFKYLNKHYFKKKFTHIELVSILALIFITFNYHLVYQEAFYIGFLLSVSIPFLNNSLAFINKKKIKIIFPILIYFMILPISLENGSFHPLTILEQSIIFVPNLVFLVLSQLSIVIPFYGIVNNIGKGILWILEKMVLIDVSIPFANLGGAFLLLYYGFIFYGMYFLEAVRIKHFKLLCCGLMSLFLISIVPLQDPILNAVYFINVGQGDSILIKNRSKTVLIDTGGYKNCDMAKDSLIPFMNKSKITHIDTLIITHDDFDHSGAKDSLINNFKVYNCITEKEQFPYKIGDLYFENLNTMSSDEDNDKSLVLKLNFMNKKWLFTGDASTIVENYMIKQNYDLNCDILKIGHHGSKSSTSEGFIKSTSPKVAIISVGANNYYGHPTNEVIDRLTKYNVKIRRTDLEGTISYLSLLT